MADIINGALVDMLFGGSKSVATEVSGAPPLTLTDGKAKALNGLTLYGSCTQDGSSTPDNPIPVVPVGAVMTTGAQLFYTTKTSGTSLGTTWTVTDDGAIRVYGTPTADGNIRIIDTVDNFTLPAGTYTFSSDEAPDGWAIYLSQVITDESGTTAWTTKGQLAAHTGKTATFEFDGNGVISIYYIWVGTVSFDTTLKLMLNEGSTALEWEPYTGGVAGVNPYEGEIGTTLSDGGANSQTLVISTPGGLCGIPVASGGNYTDANGQQWLADYVDFASGSLTKNAQLYDLTSASIFRLDSRPSSERAVFDCGCDTTVVCSISNLMCNRFPTVSTGGNKGYSYILPRSDSNRFYISVQYGECGIESSMTDSEILTAFRAWAGENRVYFYEPVSPQTTVQLTDEEIAAYKALMTYDGTTIIASDANYMTVNYAQKGSGGGSSALAWFFKREGNELI